MDVPSGEEVNTGQEHRPGVLGVQRRVLENFATARLKAKKIMSEAFLEALGIERRADRGRSITSPEAKNQEQL